MRGVVARGIGDVLTPRSETDTEIMAEESTELEVVGCLGGVRCDCDCDCGDALGRLDSLLPDPTRCVTVTLGGVGVATCTGSGSDPVLTPSATPAQTGIEEKAVAAAAAATAAAALSLPGESGAKERS